jgi:methylmalonyl-CoA/ethylmalonyl-CoA epimerase
MLKRVDHVGVIVDDLDEAVAFLARLGLRHSHDVSIPGRLKGSFFKCGQVNIEMIEIQEPSERAKRLGDEKARIEHIAIEVEDLEGTRSELELIGIRMQTEAPVKVGTNLNYWTQADTCDGIVYQLLERA